MQEELVTLETAKLAKEKGFNIFTDVCFANTPNSDNKQYKKIKLHHSHSVGSVDSFGNILTIVAYAPTQSLLAKWLREEYNIHVTSQIGNLDFINTYHYEIRYIDKNKFMCKVNGNFKTYEEALEIGLQEVLKLIPNI